MSPNLSTVDSRLSAAHHFITVDLVKNLDFGKFYLLTKNFTKSEVYCANVGTRTYTLFENSSKCRI